MELKGGWVEVLEGNEVRKGRVSDYVVVPSDSQVGSKLFIQLEKEQAHSELSEMNSLSDIEIVTMNNKGPPSNSVDPNIKIEDLFYWQCHNCQAYNFFCYGNCESCNITRTQGNSSSSALLQIAEVAVQNVTTFDEALKMIDTNQQDSIPSSILSKCLERKDNGITQKEVLAKSTKNVADYYYWLCGFCTVKNNYRFFTCKCCGNEVSLHVLIV